MDSSLRRADGEPGAREDPDDQHSGIYTGSSLRDKAALLGITTVLEKPVDYDRLLDVIERHCPGP
jgi:hypothetical protein